jgi:hypothetical protein
MVGLLEDVEQVDRAVARDDLGLEIPQPTIMAIARQAGVTRQPRASVLATPAGNTAGSGGRGRSRSTQKNVTKTQPPNATSTAQKARSPFQAKGPLVMKFTGAPVAKMAATARLNEPTQRGNTGRELRSMRAKIFIDTYSITGRREDPEEDEERDVVEQPCRLAGRLGRNAARAIRASGRGTISSSANPHTSCM